MRQAPPTDPRVATFVQVVVLGCLAALLIASTIWAVRAILT